MNDSLKKLLEAAKTAKQSPAQLEEQRRCFVYGNTAFENSLITREMVDQEAEKLAREADAATDKQVEFRGGFRLLPRADKLMTPEDIDRSLDEPDFEHAGKAKGG